MNNLDAIEQKLQATEYSVKIGELVKNGTDFVIVGFSESDEMSIATKNVENKIEKLGLKCRIYTENRSIAIAAMAVPTGIAQITGAAAAIGIAAHNLATWNPDYEIVKDKINNRIGVICKNRALKLKKKYKEDE